MTAEPLVFDVPKRNVEKIPFVLKGKTKVYMFTPPKQAEMILPMIGAEDDLAASKAAFEWLDNGLSKADQEHIRARLLDHKDDLDVDTIVDVVTRMTEVAGSRPTT